MKTIIAIAGLVLGTLWAAVPVAAAEERVGQRIHDAVDLIEINHYYDVLGREIFTQTIFWRAGEQVDRAIAYRVWRPDRGPLRPSWNARCGCYEVIWLDDGLVRRVTSGARLEIHTQYDRELDARLRRNAK